MRNKIEAGRSQEPTGTTQCDRGNRDRKRYSLSSYTVSYAVQANLPWLHQSTTIYHGQLFHHRVSYDCDGYDTWTVRHY